MPQKSHCAGSRGLLTRHMALMAALLLTPAFSWADVIISEYVEGSSFNKGLELYNTTMTPFDLDGNDCELRGFQNGAGSASYTIDLSLSVPAQDVIVIAHPDASFSGDVTANLEFNGDDAIGLYCGGSAVDIIGQIGNDPGSEWGTGLVSTRDNTIRRKSSVCIGDDNGADAFDPSVEWDGFANGTFDGLGMHTASCGPDITAPEITSVTPSTTGPTNATSIDFTVVFSEPVTDFVDPADVTVTHNGTASTQVSFMVISGSTHVVTVSGISGMGTFSLTVNANSVTDTAGNPNIDTLTSVDVTIDPNVMITTPEGLLLTEVVVGPDGAEFIEIHNSSGDSIDLSDVYLTDATFAGGAVYYYQIVNDAGGGGGFGDFHARFPGGSSIAAGTYQTIAINGSDAYQLAYGIMPDYELYEDGMADGVPDMLEAFSGSIAGQGALSDGEVAILYYWDGMTDLVADLDYVVWGDRNEAVDKTGVMIDGPDADMVASGYMNDTAIAEQAVIDSLPHVDGESWQRADLTEGLEIDSGGNGLEGHDETSEPFRLTWGAGTPTPGLGAGPDVVPPGPSILINEVNAVDSTDNEFIELFDGGVGNTSLSGLVMVMFDDSDISVAAIDLDGVSTNVNGYLIIGGVATTPDVALPQPLDDGAAAIAIYVGDAVDFSNGTAVTTDGLIDALVYDSGQPDQPGLLVLLQAAEPQVNEDENAAAASESMQRCPNGSGGRRITSTYAAVTPTLGMINASCPLGDYYANVIDTSAAQLRTTLHDTIDDHQWYPYSSGATDTWDILDMADENPADNQTILDVYRNAPYTKAGGGNSFYNREHTWPRSLGLGETGTPLNSSATDTHNLRLSDIGYNSDRGSKPFADCPMVSGCSELVTLDTNGQGGGSGVYPGNSNWHTDGTDGNMGSFEVWHDRRGDVARSIFYMDIRYEGGTHGGTGQSEPNLELTNDRNLIQSTTGSPAYMGLLSTLLQWHLDDPVDSREQDRNEVIFAFQGNRNPFVDHPEWIDCLYNDVCAMAGDDIFADGFE